jgi:metallo-beta-lactamase class B
MKMKLAPTLTACVLPYLLMAVVVSGYGQAGGGPSAENDRSRAYIESARRLAGEDVTAPFDFYCVAGNARGTGDNPPDLEPVKLFDNLYAAGNTETTVHAITTSDGIILIDSGHAEKVEDVLVPGLRALGLDPADVKYILLGHGHADHYGGAAYFQERYGTRVGLGVEDWDLVEASAGNPNSEGPTPPKRDMVIVDGEPITLGDTTVTPVWIPGHTPGSMAYIFPVRDGETTRMAGMFAGTMLSSFQRSATPGIEQYIASIDRYLDVAESLNVEVEIQNHPLFDDTPLRLERLKARSGGEPHPFVMGNESYTRFWQVVAECMHAEIARRDENG